MRARVAAWALLAWLVSGSLPAVAKAQEVDFVPPDSAFKAVETTYDTSYDRDRTRGMWTQTLSYGTSTKHTSFNGSGYVSTQDFIDSKTKSTVGSIYGTLTSMLARNFMAILSGNYSMNSSRDLISGADNRDNRLNMKLQYSMVGRDKFRSLLSAYTEFGQKHDRNRFESSRVGSFEDTVRVDSTLAERDSSRTDSRMDGMMGEYTWNPGSWLAVRGTAQAFRIHPTITSSNRTFVHPMDASGGGYVLTTVERTQSPTGNTAFTQRVSMTRLPRTKIDVYGERRRLSQSYFDKPRARQESAKLESNQATLHMDTAVIRGFFLNADATLGRQLNTYTLNTSRNQLTRDGKILSSLTYADSTRRGNLTFIVDRSRTELNPNSNGVEIDRNLLGNLTVKTSRKLALEALGSASLMSNDYENDRNDRDVQRTSLSVGAGYVLARPCSTTVHFSRIMSHTVNLDPSHSAENAVTTTYQVNATLQYLPNRNFSVRQNYILNAEYRILDYVESQNSLRRTRRIDTDVSDTLLSVVFVTVTHNFIFKDQGVYARFGDHTDRRYRIATRSYDQTLIATAGLKIVPGITFVATQSLWNNTARALASPTGTMQNTWKLNLGLLVNRTLPDGIGINGAVRRIEEYVEDNPLIRPRHDWIAGVSIHKGF